MSKIRIYLEKEIIKGQKILLDHNHIHYLKNVMRKKSEEKIFVFNQNSEWECKLNFYNEKTLTPINYVRKKNMLPDIWLYFGIVKIKNVNTLIEKTSEIGVKKIVPIFTEFSSKINLKINRLKKISIEAIEQSNSISLPEISEVQTLKNVLEEWDENRIIFFCDEKGGNRIFETQLMLKKFKKIAIFIGPIGGWSSSDRKLFKNKKVFKISLGDNILKADTAAIYSLSCVRALLK